MHQLRCEWCYRYSHAQVTSESQSDVAPHKAGLHQHWVHLCKWSLLWNSMLGLLLLTEAPTTPKGIDFDLLLSSTRTYVIWQVVDAARYQA